jgi:hypothetical protein
MQIAVERAVADIEIHGTCVNEFLCCCKAGVNSDSLAGAVFPTPEERPVALMVQYRGVSRRRLRGACRRRESEFWPRIMACPDGPYCEQDVERFTDGRARYTSHPNHAQHTLTTPTRGAGRGLVPVQVGRPGRVLGAA